MASEKPKHNERKLPENTPEQRGIEESELVPDIHMQIGGKVESTISLKRSWELAVEEVKKRFPDCYLEKSERAGGNDEEWIKFFDKEGNQMGKIVYYFPRPAELSIDIIKVRDKLTEKGISKALFASVLLQNPEITKISGSLSRVNSEIFVEKVEEGMSKKEAIRETPFYKSMYSLGFSVISEGLEAAFLKSKTHPVIGFARDDQEIN